MGLPSTNRFLLAPMAGITDAAFRVICTGLGAGMTYTEMISAKALTYRDKKTAGLLYMPHGSQPCAVQLFGSEPQTVAEAAKIAYDMTGSPVIDLNMGCPVAEIVSNGEGSALMRDFPRAAAIIEAVRRSVPSLVTVKFRSGYEQGQLIAPDFARMCEQSGADALCVHTRTRAQMYAGKADDQVLLRVIDAVRLPVAASGDALDPMHCLHLLSLGASHVMIARGCLGNPFIFEGCLCAERGEAAPPVTLARHLEMLLRHMALMCEFKGERAIVEGRRHILWYLNKIANANAYKARASQLSTLSALTLMCEEILMGRHRMKHDK